MIFIVYAGANGAGKSSLRATAEDAVVAEIDPDRIARELNPDDPRSVDFAAGKEALRRFDQLIGEGAPVSLETTLTGRTVFGRMQAARRAGYRILLRYVALSDVTMHIDRVRARVVRGGHWIDPDVIRRRVLNSMDNLPTAIALSDQALLFDNSGTEHRQVLRVERGRVVFTHADQPAWLAAQLPRILAALAAPG